jgi:hypothetical protein
MAELSDEAKAQLHQEWARIDGNAKTKSTNRGGEGVERFDLFRAHSLSHP